MSKTEDIGRASSWKLPSIGKYALALFGLALAVGCGDSAPIRPPGTGAFGGSGGSTGTGGMAGVGGVVGAGGVGGMAGSGGSAGAAGMAGSGGSAGTGGAGACVTSALCHSCPSEVLVDALLCNPDGSCDFPGYSCVPSGCETHGGASIGQCQPAPGPSCINVSDCPDADDYVCTTVGAGGKHCVRTTLTPECDPANETYDCAPGFSCEGPAGQETCVDRRVPCNDFSDCPKSHVCRTTPTARFCARVYRTCRVDEDCATFGRYCADIDGDGTKECAGEYGDSANPCVNSTCMSSSAPVCEAGATGNAAVCGDYGLCRTGADCDTGFSCVGLWQDGRKECVRTPLPSDCEHVTDCGLQQVCAAHRNGDNGGRPSCQTGTAP